MMGGDPLGSIRKQPKQASRQHPSVAPASELLPPQVTFSHGDDSSRKRTGTGP